MFNDSTLEILVLILSNFKEFTIESTTWIFLAILSTNVKLQSGNKIANGIPGNPPPVPTSKILVLFLKLIILTWMNLKLLMILIFCKNK